MKPEKHVTFLKLLRFPLFLLLALVLVEFVFIPLPQAITITMGHEAGLNAHGQGEHLHNFFGWGHTGTEQGLSARRIEPTASFMVPWAYRMGDPLYVDVTMCGCGSTDPVLLSINGTLHEVPLSNAWETYLFMAYPEPTIYGQSLYLEWRSDATPRPLVHRVEVQSPSIPWMPELTYWIGMVLPLALWGLWHWGLLQQIEISWALVLAGSLAASRLLYEPHALAWSTLVVLGTAAALALSVLCRPLWRRLVLWGCTLWLLAVPQLLGTWVLDDAFISFRYAKNLVNGYGLTFNPGGEIVEGYSNFLWTIIMAGSIAVGFDPLITAQVLCTALALAVLLLLYRLAAAWWPDCPWSLLPPVLLVLNPSFLLYTTRGSGMETALVTFLALAALWLIWRARTLRTGLLAGGMCALVVMTRPDGALVPMAGGLLLLAQTLIPARRARAWPALQGLVGGFLLLYGPYFVWRWSYYGYLLPNTFYAKTGATAAQVRRGLAYTWDFVQSLGLRSLIVLLGLSIAGLARALWPAGWREQAGQAGEEEEAGTDANGPAPLLWLFVLLTCLYTTLIGGDHFPLGRFFVPMVPPLVLLVTHGVMQAWALRGLLEKHSGVARRVSFAPPAAALLALLLFVSVNVSPLPRQDSRDPGGRIWGETQVVLKNREAGWWFYFNTPPDTVIATGIAGALPYYAERPVIDTLGLNNTHIAHLEVETIGQGIAGAEKTDVGYVLAQEPDYIPYSSSGPYQELAEFQRLYRLRTVRGPEGGEIILYQRQE